MNLSCSGYQNCYQLGDSYFCNIRDSNYIFISIDRVYYEENHCVGDKIPGGNNPNYCIYDLRIIHEKDNIITEYPLDFTFIFDYKIGSGMVFKCEINRPHTLPPTEKSKLDLKFKTNCAFNFIKFNVNKDHEGNYLSLKDGCGCNLV